MEVGEAEAGKQLPFQPRERAAVQGAGSGGHKDLGFISLQQRPLTEARLVSWQGPDEDYLA